MIVFDDDPEYAYYVNLGTKKFVGRYSFTEDGYSLLAEEDQREEIGDIPPSAFPPLGELPAVQELMPETGNNERLLDPPPTREYPRLQRSRWKSMYLTADRKPIKATVEFAGPEGVYVLESGAQGQLSQVSYAKTDAGLFEIQGIWRLGDSEGYFVFRIAPENVNAFQGEWGRQRIDGTWSGSRIHEGD